MFLPGLDILEKNPYESVSVFATLLMVRFQPNYPPVNKRLSVLAKGARATGAQRKKAIVAVARHLAVDLWRLHTGRCTAQQLGLKIQKVSSRGTEQEGASDTST